MDTSAEPGVAELLDHALERIADMERELADLRGVLQSQAPWLGTGPEAVVAAEGLAAAGEWPRTAVDHWSVTWLGPFRLVAGEASVPSCGSRRGQSVLKYLLASPNHTASAETLVDCFWPAMEARTGMHNLQMAVHALRRSLQGWGPDGGGGAILFLDDRYRLNPRLTIVQDVDAFRAAAGRGKRALRNGDGPGALRAFEEAQRHYGGDFLADSPRDEWAASTRLELQDLHLSVLGQLSVLYGRGGDWERAAASCREILAVDGYREDAYRQLMRSQAAAGRLADVQRTFRSCQERLRDDLQLDPAPETVAVYRQLVRGAVS